MQRTVAILIFVITTSCGIDYTHKSWMLENVSHVLHHAFALSGHISRNAVLQLQIDRQIKQLRQRMDALEQSDAKHCLDPAYIALYQKHQALCQEKVEIGLQSLSFLQHCSDELVGLHKDNKKQSLL